LDFESLANDAKGLSRRECQRHSPDDCQLRISHGSSSFLLGLIWCCFKPLIADLTTAAGTWQDADLLASLDETPVRGPLRCVLNMEERATQKLP
jgi:hypothetical protein